MSKQVLVAYASKYGGTAEIAQKIGQVLSGEGLQAVVLPAAGIRDLSAYEAVILGSAVYIGRWRKEAVKFLESNEKSLAERAVWLFSSGPTGEGAALELTEGWRFPSALQPIADRIQPRDTTLFKGVVKPERLNPIERWLFKNVRASLGDFRDWEAVTAWAKGIAGEIKAQRAAAGGSPQAG
jgi:menaquinone-dependent protoporphyrinogen oxidase